MKKIKVLMAIRQGQIGGGESHVLELATHINRNIYEPIVLAFTPGAMMDELAKRGIETHVIPTEKPFDYKVWDQVRSFMIQKKIDIVHAHGTRAMSNVYRAAHMLKLPLLYTVHGWSFHKKQNLVVKNLRILSEKFLASRANAVVCVSVSNQREGIERFNLKNSSVIYNAVNIEKFNPIQNFKNLRDTLGIGPGITVIGYIARITEQKDPFTMLRAMKIHLQNVQDTLLLVVGDGNLKTEMMELAKELNIDKNIIFEPFRTDIPDVLNAIDYYCLPSLWEGFPIGIIEAMCMKKAVIASAVDGTSELIQHKENGLLVEPGNPAELAQNMLFFHNNLQFRQQIAENAYQKAIQNFTINRLVGEVEGLYHHFSM